MEVSILPKNILRLKSKQASFLIDATEKLAGTNAVAYLTMPPALPEEDGVVPLYGPGDYEIGSVKIYGMRSGENTIYSFLLDGVEVLIGRVGALEKMQNKLKEYEIVVLLADETAPDDAAFATGLATNVLMAYGSKAKALIDSFGKENTQSTNKFASTRDKLPQEMQTILLADGK